MEKIFPWVTAGITSKTGMQNCLRKIRRKSIVLENEKMLLNPDRKLSDLINHHQIQSRATAVGLGAFARPCNAFLVEFSSKTVVFQAFAETRLENRNRAGNQGIREIPTGFF